MRVVKATLDVVILGSALFATAAALGAGAPAAGAMHLYATPSSDGIHATILLTGAIGDHGEALSINKNGKVEANGNFVKITLKKGTFELNSTTLDARFKNAQPAADKATCSAQFSGTGPVSLFNGTGLYTDISGTLNITETFAFVGPLYKTGKHKGQCNESNSAQPLGVYSSITGTGTVKFS
jgi:hypothetical protein